MKKELKRQFLHFFLGCTAILSLFFFGMPEFIAGNIIMLIAGFLVSDAIKKGKKIPAANGIIKKFLDYAGRDSEKEMPGKGALTFFAGTLIASLLFYQNKLIVIGAIIPLVFGDSFSTVFGKFAGKTKIKDKTLEGSIAGITISFIYLSVIFPLPAAFTAAAAGMAMEYLPIEDNYTIPIAAGTALMLLI